MNQKYSDAAADVASGGRGLARLNPTPRKAYTFTVKIKDAPGPFAVVNGGAQYDVANRQECGRIIPATGTAGRITSHEDVPLQKISSDEYRGTVYLDLMQDDDYYGRGVCHWDLTTATILMRATGAKVETRFIGSISVKNFNSSDDLVLYYPDRDYPRAEMDDYGASGERRDYYKPELQDHLFSIAMSVREAES